MARARDAIRESTLLKGIVSRIGGQLGFGDAELEECDDDSTFDPDPALVDVPAVRRARVVADTGVGCGSGRRG